MSAQGANGRVQDESKARSSAAVRAVKRGYISDFREHRSETDKYAWRVDHMGDVAPNPHNPTEHTISVWMSPIVNASVSHLDNGAVDISQRRKVLLGSGQLPDVSPGSVWRDGCPAAVAAVRIRKLRLNLKDSSYVSHTLIPESVLRYGTLYPQVGSSKLLAISNEGGDVVALIPVIELIRFYHCTESELARLLFWGEWEGAFVRKRTEYVENGPIDVCLNNQLTLNAAFTLSRFILSHTVQNEVSRIGAALRLAHMRHRQAELECGFPFSDETTLEVIAKEFVFPRHDGQWRRGILVYEIRSCSHGFPFTECFAHYRTDSRRGPLAETLSPIHIPSKPPAASHLAEAEQGFTSQAGEPTKAVSAYVLQTVQTRFKALQGKRVTQRPRTTTQHFKNVPKAAKQPAQPLQGIGTAAGRAGGAVAPGRIETGTDASTPLAPQLSVFLKASELLKASATNPRIVAVEAVSLSDRSAGSETEVLQTINLLSIASHLAGRGFGWSHLCHVPRIGRRLAILEVAFEADEYVYLSDIERRPDSTSESFAVICFAGPSLARVGGERITRIAEAVIRKRGWPRLESRLNACPDRYLADTTPHIRIAATLPAAEASAELDQFSRRLLNLVLRVRQASFEAAPSIAN